MTDIPPEQQPPETPTRTASQRPPVSPDETDRSAYTRPVLQPPPVRSERPPDPQLARAPQPRPPGKAQQRRPSYPAAAPPPAPYPVQEPSYAPPRAPQRRAVPPSESGLYLPWWSLVLLVGMVGMIALGLVFAFTEMSEPQTPGNQPPRVQVVTSQPTLNQVFAAEPGQQPGAEQPLWPTAIPQAFPTATIPLPTPAPSPTLPPGELGIGISVQVVGVGPSGLNMRSAPGLQGTPRFLALDGEIFVIVDGPQSVDDMEWWRLEDPNDSSRFGWAARNFFMTAVQ